jgi:hypothetical protein
VLDGLSRRGLFSRYRRSRNRPLLNGATFDTLINFLRKRDIVALVETAGRSFAFI